MVEARVHSVSGPVHDPTFFEYRGKVEDALVASGLERDQARRVLRAQTNLLVLGFLLDDLPADTGERMRRENGGQKAS